jgi:hypothetical protein
MPVRCPVCTRELAVTHLQCTACGTDVTGNFALNHLASVAEPHATVIEMFLRSRGNLKDLERALGLSYPTVRARLEEALNAAGFEREVDRDAEESALRIKRKEALDALESGEITVDEAAIRLREHKSRRNK